MISVELSDKEAELFKTFRQYQDIWEKVFKMVSGSATLHFNAGGEIKQVDYHVSERFDI